MGVLNCSCFKSDIKGINEIITGNNLKPHKLILALDSLKTTLSPKISSENFNLKQNKDFFYNNKDKYSRLSLQSKKESSTEEDIIINDIDYNTIEICSDLSESNDKKKNDRSLENICKNNYNKIKLKQEEDLLEYDDEFSADNNLYNLHKENNIINDSNNNQNKFKNEIKNINLIINDKSNLNNFINEKINEQRKNEFEKEDGVNLNELKERNDNNKHYNLIIGNTSFNFNNQNNLYINNFNDVGGNYNIINQKIDEENEEYEQDKDIIDLSDSNTNINLNININKCKSLTFSQKNMEKCTLSDNKTNKSEELKTRKGTKIEETNYNLNYYDSNNNQKEDDRSVISYEIEYVENCNKKNNEEEDLEEENKDIINNDEIKFDESNNEKKEKENKKINFINNIELKITDNINKLKDYQDRYIITDAFCDYDPDI